VFRVKLFALTGPAGTTLVDVTDTDVTGLDPATGKTRWNIDLPRQTTIDGIATVGDGIVMQISDNIYAIGGH
jgi:outer membrane protein assembly factor BamB